MGTCLTLTMIWFVCVGDILYSGTAKFEISRSTLEQIYKLHENDKKCPYLSRVLEVEQGTFAPLVFTTTGGMSEECQCYHSHLAELQTVKKQESYVSNIAWIRTQVSFAILRSALVCQRGSHSRKITTPNIQETDLELEVSVACR